MGAVAVVGWAGRIGRGGCACGDAIGDMADMKITPSLLVSRATQNRTHSLPDKRP